MNDAQIDRRRNHRASKVHKVAPVTRAIRAALAASATMLALSGTALAQDACDTAPRSLQACAGSLAARHADASLAIMPVDLTIVVGDQQPVSAIGAEAWSNAAIDTGSIANGIVIGSYSGGIPYADLTQLDIVDVVSAVETVAGYDATAIGAFVNGGEGMGLLINGGDITASATSDIGTALAVGAFTYAIVATAINDTTIVADALTDTGNAAAIGLQAYGMNAATYNYGDITANATATGADGTAGAYGLYTAGILSAVSDNQGDITVVATGDARAAAIGVYNASGAYDSVIRNSGNVSAHAISNGAGGLAGAAGLQASSSQGWGTVDVHNAGDLSVTAEAHGDFGVAAAYGVLATNGPYGDITVRNDGTITAVATAVSADRNLVNAFGTYSYTYGGTVSIVNNGDIVASGRSFSTEYGTVYAEGIYAFGGAVNGVVSDIRNNGGISVDATTYDGKALAYGVHHIAALGAVTNGADASIEVSADSEHSGVSGVTGIWNMGFQDAKVVNDGSIDAYSHAAGSFYYSYAGSRAMGIYAGSSPFGNVSVVNNGDIGAVAVSEDAPRSFGGSAGATGIMGYARIVDIRNNGDIAVSAHANAGIAGVYGVINHGKYSSNIVNAGDITAYAYAGTIADDAQDYAGRAVALGTQIFGTRFATQTNTGDISATAIVADPYGMPKPAIAVAYGVSIAATRTAALTTSGDISAYSRADSGYADAYGVRVKGKQSSLVTNSGDISAEAHADDGLAWAVGVYEQALETATTGAASLVNSGDIRSSAFAAGGKATSYGAVLIGRASASVTNSGDITSVSEGDLADAHGLLARSLIGTSYVTNGGLIGATATSAAGDARADGVVAIGTTVTTLLTDGIVYADANATGGNAVAYGAYVKGGMSGIGLLINGGDIDATATADGGLAYAVGAVAYADVATVINDDHVGAAAHAIDGDAVAIGMQAYSFNAGVYNYGDLVATAVSDTGNAGAQGIKAYGYFSSIVDNVGDITVGAQSAADATGTGVYSVAIFSGTTATNSGTVTVDVEGENATANGLLNATLYLGDASVTNDGDIDVTAHGRSKAFAVGAYNFAYAYDATLTNSGDIVASARAEGNPAAAQYADVIGAQSVNIYGQGFGDSTLVNDGSISALGWVEYGVGQGWGAIAQAGPLATASIENTGTLYANVHADKGLAAATGAYAKTTAGIADVVNHGDISALSSISNSDTVPFVQYADATGIKADSYPVQGYMGGAYVTNDGSLHAQATAGGGIVTATGVFERGKYTALSNTGEITVISETTDWGGAFAYGANIHATYNGSVTNDGTITVLGAAHDDESGHYGASRATGIYVEASMQGDIQVVNNGDITAISTADNTQEFFTGGAMAKGIDTYGKYDVVIDNHGDIHAIAQSAGGAVASYGALVEAKYAAYVTNAADAVIVSNASVSSLEGDTYGGRAASAGVLTFRGAKSHVENDGTIIAHATVNPASVASERPSTADAFGTHVTTGVLSEVINHGDIEAVATADLGYASAYGTFVTSGIDASTANAGSIVAAAYADEGNAWAVGTYNLGYHRAYQGCDESGCHYLVDDGNAWVDNEGDIVALARAEDGVADAYGAVALGVLKASITNAGHITAIAEGDDAAATGALANAMGTPSDAQNSGAIAVSATGTTTSDARGVVLLGTTGVTLDNTGSMVVGAYGSAATATGASMESAGGTNVLTNAGDITAISEGADVSATGVLSSGFLYGATLHNGGSIAAIATGEATAKAIAADLTGTGAITFDNAGNIVAGAYGPVSNATALWVDAAGANALTNAGHITANAEGDDAHAAAVQSNSFSTVHNSGSIAAIANGATSGHAIAADLTNTAGITFDNSGNLVAGAYGPASSATALWLNAAGTNVVANSGTIAAYGDGERVAIASHVDATATIANTGTIIGDIHTGDLADSFDNAAGASWMTAGTSTFGGGDDALANAGTLLMQDATIDFGGYAASNAFSNTGSLFASGHDTIAMGGAFAARNDGTISFLDGATDDVLTIDGDFAGQGKLVMDVSGWHNTSDLLYVTGNVVDPTTQTLDVDVIDLPHAPFVQLPMVYVEGDSSARQFVLGNVRTNQNDFTTLDVTLDSQINAGNASSDMFYLGVSVTGLNDQGAIATALSPGVARLIDAQIGTWRQRMGVVPVESSKTGLAPFVRGFSDSGDVDPDHAENFGSGGDYGFSQSNHGWDVGIDSRPGDNVAFGVVLSKSEGNQRLDNGLGRTDLTGTGFGLYLTYLGSQGAYVDGSVRWTGVEARLHAATAFHKTHGSAETMNIEAGLDPWIVGGIGIQPQLQYTFTRIADFEGMQGASARFVEEGGDSERGRLGVLFSKNYETNGVLLTPYGSVNAVHEFNGEYAYSINDNALFGSTSLDGTSAMVELGLGARKDKWSLSGGFNWTDGAALDGLFGGQVVVRYSW